MAQRIVVSPESPRPLGELAEKGPDYSGRRWAAYVSVSAPSTTPHGQDEDGDDSVPVALPRAALGLVGRHKRCAVPFFGKVRVAMAERSPPVGSVSVADDLSEVSAPEGHCANSAGTAETTTPSSVVVRQSLRRSLIYQARPSQAGSPAQRPAARPRLDTLKPNSGRRFSGAQGRADSQPSDDQVCDLAKSCRRFRGADGTDVFNTFSENLMSPSMTESVPVNSVLPTTVARADPPSTSLGIAGSSSWQVSQELRPRSIGSRISHKGSRVERGTRELYLADGLFDKVEATGRSSELSVFEAAALAAKFNLPSGQVTQAWKFFKRYDTNDRGVLSDTEFQLLLRYILRERHPTAKGAPRELFDRAADQGRAASFMDLLTWMSVNAFSEHLLLSEEQKFIRNVARKHKADVPVVEGIKSHFDTFDSDGSGKIEYEEFGGLLRVLLKVKDMTSLPESRILAFWRELDGDGSGIVDFKEEAGQQPEPCEEFIPWYLSYFAGSAETSPLEGYYRNIRRVPFQWKACTK